MRPLKLRTLSVLICLCVVACRGNDGGTSDGTELSATGDAGTNNADGSVVSDASSSTNACSDLSYELFGQAFLENYCVRCHGSPVVQNNVRLDTLANLIKNKKKAKSEVSTKGMPPRGETAPSSAERTMFSQWIDCGPL